MIKSTIKDELSEHTYVILYTEMDSRFDKLIAYTDDDCYLIDINGNDHLYKEIMDAYDNILELPALLYRGSPVSADMDVSEELNRIDSENIKKTGDFVSGFLQPVGITVFIKGTIVKPYCKFTKQLVSIFTEFGFKNVKDFNILTDNKLRYYIKILNKWPSFPMIYINGKFIGGLDSFKSLLEERSSLLFGDPNSTA
ncbi:hypothetical protein PAEPH01_1148 [Pancytospora epiphaga]|nr:hypothetical protein PAEPH01_1148 [Pancytospora epiphaga]